MPRHGIALGLIQKKVFISPSQEEVFEAIPGWDDVQQAGRIIDDTPSQAADPENSSQNSLQRVFDVTGSTLSEASQEAVEWASPEASSARASGDAATKEDSYNEAFESDRSQSPLRTVSWGLVHGCKDPKSPTSVAVPEEVEERPLILAMSNGEDAPAGAGVNSTLIPELSLDEAAMAAEDVKEESRTEGSRIGNGDDCPQTTPTKAAMAAEDVKEESRTEGSRIGNGDDCPQTTAPVQAMPLSPNGVPVSPRDIQGLKPSVLALESLVEGFGSGRASAFMSLKRKGQDSPSAVSGEHPATLESKDGLVNDVSVAPPAAENNTPLKTLNDVQCKLQSLEYIMSEGGRSETERSSPVQSFQNGLDKLKGAAAGEVGVEMEHIPPKVTLEEVENHSAAVSQELRVEVSRAADDSEDLVGCTQPLFSPTSLKILMDAVRMRSAGKPAASVAPEDGAQHIPPRAVQEKLDRLRSHGGKRVCRDNSNNFRDRLWKDFGRSHEPHFLPACVMDAIQFRSGARPAPGVTTAELLNTALHVGVSLPPPFHRRLTGHLSQTGTTKSLMVEPKALKSTWEDESDAKAEETISDKYITNMCYS